MALINPCHRGLAYGDGHIQGDGQLGQVVRVVGDDLFAVNTDPGLRSFGILIKDYAAGEMPGIYTNGGVYETDAFEGTITAGEDLTVSANGFLTNGGGSNAQPANAPIPQAQPDATNDKQPECPARHCRQHHQGAGSRGDLVRQSEQCIDRQAA